MYSEHVTNSLGVTIKTCNRVKIEEENSQCLKAFVKDSGYIQKYQYKVHGSVYKFILNEFEDLKSLIPIEKQNKVYKAKLTIFTYEE